MPWQQREILQFCVLLLCVPMQYYISGFFDNFKEGDRSKIIINTMKGIEDFKNTLLDTHYWALQWKNLFVLEHDSSIKDEIPKAEAVDAKFADGYDFPRRLTKVRDKRPSHLRYRIGQVVQLNSSFIGVIIGWDNDESGQPVYTILVDESHADKTIGMLSITMEVEQNKLSILKNRQVKHNLIKWYFASFDSSQYIPRDWLKKIYPKD